MKTNFKNRNCKPKRNGKVNKNNLQDRFADREFQKGEQAEEGKWGARHTISQAGNNDPKWYFKDQRLLSDVASYSFSHPLGNPIKVDEVSLRSAFDFGVPGVMGIEIGITPGVSRDAQSPINLAAVDMYSFVRYKNSGASNYDPTDLMMYVIACDSLYTCWNWMRRIYGYASTYSQVNKYKPKGYALLDNVNLQDIYSNLADFRAYLNMAANRISSFACPAVFTYTLRHSWLFSNIFTDADTIKAQEYMYVPSYFYKFEETASAQGTSLTAVPIHDVTTPFTFQSLKTLLDGMILAMSYSEDAGIMSGDIIKAYGSSLFTLSSIDADYVVSAGYSKEVLSQIENIVFTPKGSTTLSTFNITQDVNRNIIVFHPTLVGTGATSPDNTHYLNFHWDNPTPEDVIVATRLNCVSTLNADGSLTLESCGSEVAFNVQVVGLQKTGSGYDIAINTNYNVAVLDDLTWETVQAFLNYIWTYIAFDWAPPIELPVVTTNQGLMHSNPLRDYDNFTYLSLDNYIAMNELALLSEFNIPN